MPLRAISIGDCFKNNNTVLVKNYPTFIVYNRGMDNINAKTQPNIRLSVGVFIQNSQGLWLLGHATGQHHWDIFKGMPDPDEAPEKTAVRELREETGIVLSPNTLTDTGIHNYRSDKKLHVFKAFLEVDPSMLECTSFFEHQKSKKLLAEMDAFAWYTPQEAKDKAVPRLWAILDALTVPTNNFVSPAP